MNKNLAHAMKEFRKYKKADEKIGMEILEIKAILSRPNQPMKVFPISKIRVSRRVLDRIKERSY